MKKQKLDTIIGSVFLVLTIVLITAFVVNEEFFYWAFERHHNEWSWYLRPLFLLPFCYSAYKRSFAGIMLSIFAVLTSMFWFSKPEIVNQQIIEFLKFEKDYLYGQWGLSKVVITLIVPFSLFLLALAFWKRNLLMGLVVLVLIATGKIVWSIQNAGGAGKAVLVPALVGLTICVVLVYYGFRRFEKK